VCVCVCIHTTVGVTYEAEVMTRMRPHEAEAIIRDTYSSMYIYYNIYIYIQYQPGRGGFIEVTHRRRIPFLNIHICIYIHMYIYIYNTSQKGPASLRSHTGDAYLFLTYTCVYIYTCIYIYIQYQPGGAGFIEVTHR
jgi:hypothetical protein